MAGQYRTAKDGTQEQFKQWSVRIHSAQRDLIVEKRFGDGPQVMGDKTDMRKISLTEMRACSSQQLVGNISKKYHVWKLGL